jgi:hypothetical protein
MEARSHLFSKSDLSKVVKTLSAEVKESDSNLKELFENKDSGHSGVIPVAAATSILEGFSTKPTKHVILILVRGFESDLKFDYSSLLSILKS